MTIKFEGEVDVEEHRKSYLEGLINLKSNGRFTISHPDIGRRTFRIKTETWNSGKPNEQKHRVIAYLSGPNNDYDYTRFGFAISYAGESAEIKPWKKYEYSEIIDWADILIQFIGGEPPEGWDLHAAVSCRRCSRALTVPSSVAMGIGPICINLPW